MGYTPTHTLPCLTTPPHRLYHATPAPRFPSPRTTSHIPTPTDIPNGAGLHPSPPTVASPPAHTPSAHCTSLTSPSALPGSWTRTGRGCLPPHTPVHLASCLYRLLHTRTRYTPPWEVPLGPTPPHTPHGPHFYHLTYTPQPCSRFSPLIVHHSLACAASFAIALLVAHLLPTYHIGSPDHL